MQTLPSDICIINIKIYQNKFYNFIPLTEMTGRGQEGISKLGCHQVHAKYTLQIQIFNQ